MTSKVAIRFLLLTAVAACSLDQRQVSTSGNGLNGVDASGSAGASAGDGSLLQSSLEGGLDALGYSPAELDLGSAVLGFPSFGRIRISNTGNVASAIPVVSLTSDSDPDLAIIQNQCDRSLNPDEICDVRIQAIASRIGELRGVIQIGAEPGGGALIPVLARGLQPGELLLAPADGNTADFGASIVGQSLESVFRVTNPLDSVSGPLSFSLAHPDFIVAAPGPGECQPGQVGLSGGESCDVRVAYSPSSRGSGEATLSVTSTELGSASLSLAGRGLVAGVLSVSPGARDFSGVVLGGIGAATLLVENAGDLPLTLSQVAFADDAAGQFVIASTECGEGVVLSSRDAGLSGCSVDVEFRPQSTGQASAVLVVSSVDGAERRVDLTGAGLLPGSLVLAASSGSSPAFGDVLLGESRTQAFTVSNPSAETSGTFTIEAGEDFVVLSGNAPGGCVAGETTLANGASCDINVQLAPTERAARDGSLTVTSQLAGSVSLALTGRGIIAGRLEAVQDEVNFGRVVRGSFASGVVTVRNAGDTSVAAPSITLGVATSGNAPDMQLSGCTSPLDAGQQCEIEVVFSPTQVSPYTIPLSLSSDGGGSDSVLLLANVIEPGRLVVGAAAGSTADFGDVPLETSVARTFTVTNPGGEPSGRISVTSSDNHFTVDQGDCGSAEGLIDGESCTFTVSFTPDASERLNASVLVTSLRAGETSLAIGGRGRTPAILAGSNEFNFNTVIRTQSSAPRRWTVRNVGDLATAALATTGATPEFVVTNDTCSGRSIGATQSCTMDVQFVPQATGARRVEIRVSDSDGAGSVVSLIALGNGQALPAVGQACLNGQCDGNATCENHSNGQTQVCCGTDCAGNQRCSQSQNFQACELPTVGPGERCVQGTNFCGAGLTCTDPNRPGFCCPTGCTGPCQVCTAAGVCASRPDQEKGGCGGNKVCVGGACNCSGINRESLDCGGNRCIRDVADACCDVNGCDGQDVCGANNLCGCPAGTRECTAGSNVCVANTQCCNCTGECQTCNNGTCGTVPNGQVGQCGAGRECQAGVCQARLSPAALTTTVTPGALPLTVIDSVSAPVIWAVFNSGGVATGLLRLNNSNPTEFLILDRNSCLGRALGPSGTCQFEITFGPRQPGTRTANLSLTDGGVTSAPVSLSVVARQRRGGVCDPAVPNQCQAGVSCVTWYLDQDGDGYGGEPRLGGAAPLSVCGTTAVADRPADVVSTTPAGNAATSTYVLLNNDCCDIAGQFRATSLSSTPFNVNPGVTAPVNRPATACVNNIPNFRVGDFNCDTLEVCGAQNPSVDPAPPCL